jgi:hypothetical protein
MIGIYTAELVAANARIEARWKEITQKQAQLQRLDPQIKEAEVDLKRATDEVATERATTCYYDRHWHYSSTYQAAVAIKDQRQARVYSLSSQIKTFEQKPADIQFGLPENRDKALQWLFFIVMPQEFQDLAALSHLGQSMLWAVAPGSNTHGMQCLASWFRSYKGNASVNPCQPKSRLLSLSQRRNIATPGIRSFNRRSGVFFPDDFSLNPYVERD